MLTQIEKQKYLIDSLKYDLDEALGKISELKHALEISRKTATHREGKLIRAAYSSGRHSREPAAVTEIAQKKVIIKIYDDAELEPLEGE